MRTRLLAVAFILFTGLFCGCRQPSQYGNFAKADSTALVTDTMSVMLAAYPPAKTRLRSIHDVVDSFGIGLLEAMRKNGYAVTEFVKSGGHAPMQGPTESIFAYVVDGQGDELRVTVFVGNELLSRLYRVAADGDGRAYHPQGDWTRGRWEK